MGQTREISGNEPALAASKLSQKYSGRLVLDEISFELFRGEILGVLGPNGAGKSTLIRILSGLEDPYRGDAFIFGNSPKIPKIKNQIGVVPQLVGLPESVTPREMIEFVSAHFFETGNIRKEKKEYCENHASSWDIASFQDKKIGTLSGGQKRRVAVCLAFVGDPSIVILDEPTTGLDPEARRTMWEHIECYAKTGAAILLTSHYLDEIERLSDRILLLQDGRCKSFCTKREFLNISRATVVTIVTDNPLALRDVLGDEVYSVQGKEVQIRTVNIRNLLYSLVNSGLRFEQFYARAWNLEEAMDERLLND